MRDVDGESAPVTIGIVAGEASGDALAATLIHAVRAGARSVRFAGIAGPKMEAAGCEAWRRPRSWPSAVSPRSSRTCRG